MPSAGSSRVRIDDARHSGRSVAVVRPSRPEQTVQPTDTGQGVLAPNGYRGPGSASGGPAGGLDDGGP